MKATENRVKGLRQGLTRASSTQHRLQLLGDTISPLKNRTDGCCHERPSHAHLEGVDISPPSDNPHSKWPRQVRPDFTCGPATVKERILEVNLAETL